MDEGLIVRIALLLARPGMLVAAAPVFGGTFAPTHVRLGLALLVAFILLPIVPVPGVVTLAGLLLVVARELAIGLAMALAIRALVAGAELGGHLVGGQLMLSYGSMIDPQGGVRNTLVGSLYGMLALLTFLAINGHHMLLRALAASYRTLPIGLGGVDDSLVSAAMRLLGVVFVFGLRLAAPLMVVMLLLELATGLVARAAPALNLMVVGPPLRLIVGLLAVASLVALVPGLSARFAATTTELALQAARAFR